MHGIRNVTNIEAALGYRLNKARVRSLDGRRLCCIEDMPHPTARQLGSFHGLRLLALEHCRGGALGSEHLKVIGELRHLRYLGLLGTRVAADELDAAGEAVGGLRLLQTLDLRGTAIEAVRARAADVPLRRWSQRGRRAVERDAEAGVPGGGAVALRQRWRRRLQKVLGAPGGRARWVAGAEGGRDQRAGSGGWRRHVDAFVRSRPKLKKIRRLALRYNGDHLVPHPNWSDRVRFARSASR